MPETAVTSPRWAAVPATDQKVADAGSPRVRRTGGTGYIMLHGERSLLDSLEEPLFAALAGDGAFYRVEIDPVGRAGEIMVAISGTRGRLPLLFDRARLDPAHVIKIVRDTVQKHLL
jgi:hypothetical protein